MSEYAFDGESISQMQHKRRCKMLRFSLWLSKAVNCIPAVVNSVLSISIQVALLLKA